MKRIRSLLFIKRTNRWYERLVYAVETAGILIDDTIEETNKIERELRLYIPNIAFFCLEKGAEGNVMFEIYRSLVINRFFDDKKTLVVFVSEIGDTDNNCDIARTNLPHLFFPINLQYVVCY